MVSDETKISALGYYVLFNGVYVVFVPEHFNVCDVLLNPNTKSWKRLRSRDYVSVLRMNGDIP